MGTGVTTAKVEAAPFPLPLPLCCHSGIGLGLFCGALGFAGASKFVFLIYSNIKALCPAPPRLKVGTAWAMTEGRRELEGQRQKRKAEHEAKHPNPPIHARHRPRPRGHTRSIRSSPAAVTTPDFRDVVASRGRGRDRHGNLFTFPCSPCYHSLYPSSVSFHPGSSSTRLATLWPR